MASSPPPSAPPAMTQPRHAAKPSLASSMASSSMMGSGGYETPHTSPEDDHDTSSAASHKAAEVAGEGVNMVVPAGVIPATALTPPSTTTTTGSSSRRPPSHMVRLDLLLVTGQRIQFDFPPSANLAQVKERLWSEWPTSWPSRPREAGEVRILHLGHILADGVVLGSGEGKAEPAAAGATSTSSSTPSTASKLLRRTTGTGSSNTNNNNNNNSSGGAAPVTSHRNLLPGTTTVMHVLVKGGFPSDTPAKEGKSAASGVGKKGDPAKEEGSGAAVGSSRGRGSGGEAVEGEGAGGCSIVTPLQESSKEPRFKVHPSFIKQTARSITLPDALRAETDTETTTMLPLLFYGGPPHPSRRTSHVAPP
ncbi:hypothetical protein BDZ90DRAFT_274678 [Jaminaea rosea]|uniref:UBL3-like ubiquitin domain-containing protein n=1 Tax=Jaminaea rosea TaxID=1569628 RepID=A0A316URD7_9BASI|nr:hypothetical protein BDZ90DRAFT_274678 [Jaminaea rosea]PWN27856.1 hypothetical protein BDZ90DRAFT_274678 [Jaminaea rosea]